MIRVSYKEQSLHIPIHVECKRRNSFRVCSNKSKTTESPAGNAGDSAWLYVYFSFFTSSISCLTMSLTSSSKVVLVGFQPSLVLALVGLPHRFTTSVGR